MRKVKFLIDDNKLKKKTVFKRFLLSTDAEKILIDTH